MELKMASTSEIETAMAALHRWAPDAGAVVRAEVALSRIAVASRDDGARIVTVWVAGAQVFQALLPPDAARHLAGLLAPSEVA
jgi:hypothetical protein